MRFFTRPLVLGSLFFLYLVLYIGIAHILTIKKITTVKALHGQQIAKDSISKTLKKGITELSDSHDITIYCKQLNLSKPENTVLFALHGKGIPNFNGAIFYDTLSKRVEYVYINEFK
jgi:hypothetical protein